LRPQTVKSGVHASQAVLHSIGMPFKAIVSTFWAWL